MDEFELRRIIYDYIKEVCHYSQMQVFSTSGYQKNYFQLQIDETINNLINLILEYPMQPVMELQTYSMQPQNQQQNQQQDQQQNSQQNRQPQSPQDQSQSLQNQPQNQPQNRMLSPQQNVQTEQENQSTASEQKEFTESELAQFDGSGGKPAYVAVNGIVYDITMQPVWAGGTHFGQYAGKDLSAVFMSCHNGVFDILNNKPRVGILKK